MDIAMRNGLFCSQILKVRTKEDGQEKRVLMEFIPRFTAMKESSITLKDSNVINSHKHILN